MIITKFPEHNLYNSSSRQQISMITTYGATKMIFSFIGFSLKFSYCCFIFSIIFITYLVYSINVADQVYDNIFPLLDLVAPDPSLLPAYEKNPV